MLTFLDTDWTSESHPFIKEKLLEHSVLIFRGTPRTREQQLEFTARFGTLDVNRPGGLKPNPENPHIDVLANQAAGVKYFNSGVGAYWHTDRSFDPTPSDYTVLRCVQCPSQGGHTQFADMHAAYDDLAPSIKEKINSLRVIVTRTTRKEPVSHPIVLVHPEKNKPALFVTFNVVDIPGYIDVYIDGWDRKESDEFLKYLSDHATQDRYVSTHHWQPNDVVIWDNRSVLHRVVWDFDQKLPRHMERTCTVGATIGYRIK